MDVTLLGTGSADRWPNPFCRCASCEAQRAHGVLRATTSVLVDGRVLLDLGPDTLTQATRLGADLADVTVVLVTHAHPDHWSPEALLGRVWAGPDTPLVVAGPEQVVADVERWYAGDPRVVGRRLHAGDEADLGGYSVRALRATHEVETLMYDVTGPDGARLLYATDTSVPPDETRSALSGRQLDLVLLEQTFGRRTDHDTGHLDLATFPAVLRDLRRSGAVTPSTSCVAVHLSHHNPPEPELAGTLALWGATAGRDGQTWSLSPTGDTPLPEDSRRASPQRPPRSSVSARRQRRTLVLGGVRSGKSALAEGLLADEPEVVYVATGPDHPGDADWQRRIAAHRRRRPPHWQTVTSTDLARLVGDEGPPLLVDCLTLWLTAQLDEVGAWDEDVWHADASHHLERRVDGLVAAWRTTPRRVVAVSNEVGSGVVPDTWAGRLFRDELGRLNARVAAESDAVSWVVAGLETRLR